MVDDDNGSNSIKPIIRTTEEARAHYAAKDMDYDAMMGRLRQFSADGSFISDNYQRLLEEHGEGFVAVYEGRVVAHGNFDDVLTRLDELGIRRHAPVEYLTAEPLEEVLIAASTVSLENRV